MIIKTLPIKDIRTDAGTQSRVRLEEWLVQEYYEFLTSQDKDLPPVTVFFDGLEYFLGEGFHRVMAYQRDGREYIDADLRHGTKRDAIKFSLSANSTHGLRRTNADKRKSVTTALDDREWGSLPAREIARMCDVSHTLENPRSRRSHPSSWQFCQRMTWFRRFWPRTSSSKTAWP